MSDDHPTEQNTDPRRIGRRSLLFGAGAAAVTGTLAGAAQADAAAPERPTLRASATARPDGTPVVASGGSAPIAGYVYRHVSMSDFGVEDGTVPRQYGDYGVFSGSGNIVHATVDIAPNARIRDVEWYVYNNTGSTKTGSARLWVAGTGNLNSSVVETALPATDTGITATRTAVPSADYGPFPLGTKLDLQMITAGLNLQVNGARVGFDLGAGQVGALAAPVRAYDSRRSGGILRGGEARVITLPSAVLAPGTAAVLLNVTAVGAATGGHLTVYPTGAARPTASTLNYARSAATANANAVTVGVGGSGNRQITVYAYTPVHVIVDVSGTVS